MNVYHIILEQISTGHTGHAMTFRGLNEEAGRKQAEEGIAMQPIVEDFLIVEIKVAR